MSGFEPLTLSLPRTRSSSWATWAMVAGVGFEPTTFGLWARRATTAPPRNLYWSGRRDSNPRHSAWKADALPTELLPHGGEGRIRTYEGISQQIYSLPRLTTSLPLHIWSRRRDLNPRPADYKSAALPLSYTGNFESFF